MDDKKKKEDPREEEATNPVFGNVKDDGPKTIAVTTKVEMTTADWQAIAKELFPKVENKDLDIITKSLEQKAIRLAPYQQLCLKGKNFMLIAKGSLQHRLANNETECECQKGAYLKIHPDWPGNWYAGAKGAVLLDFNIPELAKRLYENDPQNFIYLPNPQEILTQITSGLLPDSESQKLKEQLAATQKQLADTQERLQKKTERVVVLEKSVKNAAAYLQRMTADNNAKEKK